MQLDIPWESRAKNVNYIVKTKFWFDEYNGNFGKMVETEAIK